MTKDDFYILLAVMCMGQCFIAVLGAFVLFSISNYLGYTRRRLEAQEKPRTAPTDLAAVTPSDIERWKVRKN